MSMGRVHGLFFLQPRTRPIFALNRVDAMNEQDLKPERGILRGCSIRGQMREALLTAEQRLALNEEIKRKGKSGRWLSEREFYSSE